MTLAAPPPQPDLPPIAAQWSLQADCTFLLGDCRDLLAGMPDGAAA